MQSTSRGQMLSAITLSDLLLSREQRQALKANRHSGQNVYLQHHVTPHKPFLQASDRSGCFISQIQAKSEGSYVNKCC